MCPRKYVRVQNPTPHHLRHTAANRNYNSNLESRKRDPVNKPYVYYTVNDITKLFNISRFKVIKLIKSGQLPALDSECRPYQKAIENDNGDAENKSYDIVTFESHHYVILAPDVLNFCKTFHSLYGIKSAPPYYHPTLILAAAQFQDDYHPNGEERKVPLSTQGGTSVASIIEEIKRKLEVPIEE